MIISFNYWQLQAPKIQPINYIPSKSESAVILIAGSVAINGSYISYRNTKHKKHPSSDLQGTISDAANMYKLFLQSKSVDIIRVFNDVAPETKTRLKVLNSIKDLFNDNDRKRYIIYYSGHGKITGDWIFNNGLQQLEFITLTDLLLLWDNRTKNEHFTQDLVLISDSCYSGNWVNKLKSLQATNVWMQAAARADQYSYDNINGGIFTSKYVNSACRFIPTAHNFDLFCYFSGIITSSIGSLIAIIKDKLIGSVFHYLSKPFQPTYYVPYYDQEDEYYFDRIYLGITSDNKYHLHCYFFSNWADIDFIQTVNYYAKYGSFGKMGTIMLFDISDFLFYMSLLICVGFLVYIGCRRGMFDIELVDLFVVYTVGIVTRLYFH